MTMGSAVKRYELRSYDRTPMTFSVEISSLGIPSIADVKVADALSDLLPPSLWRPTPDSVLEWLSTRVVPKNRAFVDKICESIGVTPGDTFGIIDACLGLSVDDAYWVVPQGFAGSWADYNLYEHDLDAALALVAYTGHSTGQRHRAGLSTEWTTSGNYPKAWRKVGGRLLLYKAGSPLNEGTANPDHGPYSEFFAAQVADTLELGHVPYQLDVWHGRLASVCPLFTSEERGFFSFWSCTHEAGLARALPLAGELGDGMLEHAIDQYVFDAIIANPDRHANNFGFMRDNMTGSWLGPAPLFDHNLAFFPYDMPQDFSAWPSKARAMRQSGTYIDNDVLLRHIVGMRHRAWARRLLTMRLTNDERHPVEDKRLKAMENLLHAAGRWILDMQQHSTADVRRWIEGDFGWDGGSELARSFVRDYMRDR